MDQDSAGGLSVQATALHVEQGFFVDVSRRGSVGTLYIVGVDQQTWFAIYFSLAGQKQILVGLLRIGFLSVFADQYGAAETALDLPSKMPL